MINCNGSSPARLQPSEQLSAADAAAHAVRPRSDAWPRAPLDKYVRGNARSASMATHAARIVLEKSASLEQLGCQLSCLIAIFGPVKPLAILALFTLLCSCEMTGSADDAATAAEPGAFERGSAEWRGQKFARDRCSDCHGVAPLELSPVPSAPRFDAIANTPGLTRETLTDWLHRSHNFPREMYFDIPAEHIDDLVAYMITLQSDDYEFHGE